jgi:excisionase family DNA binding protein
MTTSPEQFKIHPSTYSVAWWTNMAHNPGAGVHSLSAAPVFNQKLSLSIEEAAEATGIGRSKLYEAMRDGLLQARKFGRRTIILRDDLERFLSALPKAA